MKAVIITTGRGNIYYSHYPKPPLPFELLQVNFVLYHNKKIHNNTPHKTPLTQTKGRLRILEPTKLGEL